MQIDHLRSMLDSADQAKAWFEPLGIANPRTAHANLLRLAELGLPFDLLGTICDQFAGVAPQLADPDMAFNCLERFLHAARSPMSTAALFERDVKSLPQLLRLFNTSQTLSDLLCVDPDGYDLIRTTEGRPVARDLLVEELVSDIRILDSDEMVLASLRRFKRRENLRIAYGDIVGEQPISQITRQISYVADAVVEAALDFAHRQIAKKLGRRGNNNAIRPPFVVLALGKLGGLELNYSSDIDLLMLYESLNGQSSNGQAAARSSSHAKIENQEYCNRVSHELIRLLTETTELGFAYRVDMRLRPDGKHGSICNSVSSALTYYDVRGRTWERQAYVKARPIAGNLDLGRHYLKQLEPWIYHRYLSLADITGIKALKRRIENRAVDKGVSDRNVKTGHGGIRDIEFVIQFLQLLSGGTLPKVRTGNTFDAIVLLEQNGCLSRQERSILEENYSYLRKLEHRLQIMFDLQTHQLPTDESELTKLARRMGFAGTLHTSALTAFKKDYGQRTQLNRKILDHLLHDAFGEDAETEPEVDLVNDPDPPPQFIEQALGKYAFQDIHAAYLNLMSLAEERIPFLSTRRSRLFLASIAPRLLAAISQTPDPDATLVTLSRVSDSLGGKAVLWELLSSNHPTLNLYVTLCTACPYLARILTSNPGMIDELLDSLVVEKLPSLPILAALLADLTRRAEDIEPILHSFKHAQHLRVGVRDILGKDNIRATHRALSDIAEVCLKEVVRVEQEKLVQKMGQPTIGQLPDEAACGLAAADASAVSPWLPRPDRVGQPCELIVLAMGKLGGREPNYHSDLDLVFLYEAEGSTLASRRAHNGHRTRNGTTNNHFFSELGQRIIKKMNHFGPHGQLYEVDPRLRPTGRSGSLAVPLDAFVRYFQEGRGQLWERQALCKARVIVGSPQLAEQTMAAVAQVAYGPSWKSENNAEIWEMRMKLQNASTPRNLKKGSGGTMDTEFIVQTLQLRHGSKMPQVCVPGTLAALKALEAAGCLDNTDAQLLGASYRFQRKVEAGIRLMDSTGRHDFPEDPKELAKLAYLLGYTDGSELADEVKTMFRETRTVFERILGQTQQV